VTHLQPGDICLYRWHDPLGLWIQHVWPREPVTHAEWYAGDGVCLTARERGVARYSFTARGLFAILRPPTVPDLPTVWAWWALIEGRPYGLSTLLRLTGVRWLPRDAGVCSTVTLEAARMGGADPLPGVDAATVTPGRLLAAVNYRQLEA
jgi:hypothetical protein